MSSTLFTGTAPLSPVIPFPSRREARADAPAPAVHRFELVIGVLERLLDFGAVVAAVYLAWWLDTAWRGPTGMRYSKDTVMVVAAGFGVLMVLLLDKHGDYRPCLSLLAVRETERLLRVTITGFMLALPMMLAVTKSIPRTTIALAFVTVPIALALEKCQMQAALQLLRGWGGVTRKAVILGTGTLGRNIFSTLVRSPKSGLAPVAFVEVDGPATEPVIYEASYLRKRQADVLPGPVTSKLLRRLGATVLIVASPEMSAEQVIDITAMAESAGITPYVIPEPFLEPGYTMECVELDGVLLARRTLPSKRFLYESAKRVLDVSVSAFSLLWLAPVLVAAALAVKLTSPGPALFKQKRVGRDGVLFEMYKIRSMCVDSERYSCSPRSGGDPRITPVGRFLRHTCIDELPQLVNVLRGEMSLVGPRPEMPFIVEEYEDIHRRRLAVKPGVTGLWQLSGDRSSPIHENISYDLYYIRNRSFLMDVAILLHTVVFAFRGV